MLRKAKILCSLATLCLSTNVVAEEETEVAKRPQTVQDVIVRSGVLTPKGQVAFDASVSFTQNSSNKVAVVGYTVLPALLVGRIEVSDSDRTTMTASLSMRYGLRDDTELEVRWPYVYRSDQITTRPIEDGSESETINTSKSGGGMGDIEFALRHQLNFETTPYWIAGLTLKSAYGKSPYEIDINETDNTYEEIPTGSGFWSIEPAISMLYPTDPAVIFLSFSYIYNFKDSVNVNGESTDIDLGDTISLGAGVGFALNPDLSLSMGFGHRTILDSKINGEKPEDSKLLHLDTLNFGVNYAFSPTSSISINAQAGLTEDSPDFQLTVRVPFSI
ncbi:transporter [Vibrio japonicus]|uniref:Transporter n=1 Tax=Vibrio japonicus TaxID=1824638 RepID=A0ABY5LIM9_9VIBR|nr:transporter [Vibrio japonicus]UUM30970.1 transporter [Vibrio japonicus]